MRLWRMASHQDVIFNHTVLSLQARHTMKTFLILAALLLASTPAQAQTVQQHNLTQRLLELEDKAALKRLVDTFSILADQKDVDGQMLLFTDDATVESFSNGQPGSKLVGREEIGNAFGAYLSLFDTVYHLNGQQTVDLNGDTAKGTSYCLVTLIGNEDGKTIRNTAGVYYKDEYVRVGSQWRIAKRMSYFTWRDKEEMFDGTP